MYQYPNQPQQPYGNQFSASQPLQQGSVQPGPDSLPQTPSQQPLQPPRKKKGWIVALVVGMVVLLTLCGIMNTMAGRSTNTTSTLVSTSSPPQTQRTTSQPPTNVHYKIGDTVSVESTWQVTINSAKTDPGDGQFNTPQAGNTYLLINVALKNISSKPQDASGLIQFSLRDQDGNKYDESLTYSKDPSGKVASGDPLKGTLAYEVPGTTKSFVLSFVSNILSSNQTSWDITA